MKLTCSQKNLKFALDVVSLAVNNSSTLPVLNNILLKAANKKLFLSATNLEIAINYSIPAEIKNEGSITIPAKLITNYISLLQDDEVELKVDGNYTLQIGSHRSQTKIKGITPDEFPLIPVVEKEIVFNVNAKQFAEGVDHTVFSAAVGGSRPILAGVYLCGDKDVLTFVATDSFRLAEKKIHLAQKLEQAVECVVPVRTMLELLHILKNVSDKDELAVVISKNQVFFSINGIDLISRLIEGKFPDYEKIIPKANKTKFEVGVDDLSLATKRVSLFAKENNNSIKLAATNDGKLQLATDETSVGEERAEVAIKIEGENNKIAINSNYLLDVLSHLKENVAIEMSEKLTPVVVRPTKGEDYLYIIMPLKV